MTSHRGVGAVGRWAFLFGLCFGVNAACSGSTSVQTQTEASAEQPTEASLEESTVAAATATPAQPTPAPDPAPDDTFSTEIMPILEDVCAQCHAPGGPGATHWELARAIDATIFAPSIALVTEARIMPPWPASPLSVSFRDDYSLSDEQIASIKAWADAGGLIDVDPDTPVVSTTEINTLLDPEIVAVSSSGPYQGSTDVLDDYRCIVMDLEVDGLEWILQQEFVPDQVEVVHHGIIHLASKEYREAAQELDDAEEGVGWTCHTGNGLARQAGRVSGGYTWQIGGWAPGAGVRSQPEGYGIPVRPGDFLVVQIHYHYDESAPADLSQMRFDLASAAEVAAQPGGRYKTLQGELYLGPAEIPCYEGDTDPLCDRDAAIERVRDLYGSFSAALPDIFLRQCGSTPSDYADMTDGTAWSTCDLPVRNPGRITSVTAHMHELGLAFRMTLNPDTPDEQILLDIPDWDFGWQFGYEPEDEIVLTSSDVIRVECSWNRERAPYDAVGYIVWADGTGDEMCYSSIVTASD